MKNLKSALLAGALIAFLQAMTLFGSPAILAIPAAKRRGRSNPKENA